MDAARRAEAVLDAVLVERVRAGSFLSSSQLQLVSRNKPQERSPARANGAVTCERTIDLSFDIE
jgi:hypothetical protein